MLSASHNPMPDNGIKFFARGGTKLDDAIEDAVEARMEEPWERPLGAAVGRLRVDATGEVVDGDQILGVLALAADDRGLLTERTVVATVMSNLGFRLAMERAG